MTRWIDIMRQSGIPAFWTSPIVGRRDLRLDLLRGFAVLAMIVDHVGGVSPLYAITGGNRFFVSAAEGFVFISGLLVGIIYGDEMRGRGWRAAALKALRRAFALYALTVWLTIGYATFSMLLDLPWAPDPGSASLGQFIIRTVTFQRAYYLVDIMQLYSLLLVTTPLALGLLGRGRARWLLGGSLALWLGYQVTAGRLQVPWPIEENVVFSFAPWQILFFSAMVLGYEREAIGRWWGRRAGGIPSALPGGWLGPLAVAMAGLVWLHLTNGSILGRLGLIEDPAARLDAWFDKASLPPFRLIACAIVFAFAWLLVTRGWRLVGSGPGWILLPLGSRALYAYASHLFVAAALYAAMRPFDSAAVSGPGPSLAAQLVGIAAVRLIVGWQYPRELLAWLGSPPVARLAWQGSGTGWICWPTSSFVAIVAVCFFGVATLDAPWSSLALAPSPDTAFAARSRQPGEEPRVEVTVTASRIADLETSLRPPPSPRLPSAPAALPAGADRPPEAVWPTPPRSVIADRSFYSATLKRTMPYGLYLPPGYAPDCSRRYPVVYLLHGGPTNYTEWPQMGIRDVADRLIAVGEIQPMILVFPQGEGSYFFNHRGGPAWGDYVAYDVVRHVDRSECTNPERKSRVIVGLSGGGHGALQLGLNYPNVFGIIGAHAPALATYEQRGGFFGTPAYYAQYDPMALATTAGTPPLMTWLDAGTEDPWVRRVLQLHRILFERGWRNRIEIYPGGHNTQYWSEHLPGYLRAYSKSLAGAYAGTRGPKPTGPTR